MELADVTDSKSVDGDIVWVRVPPPAPNTEKNESATFWLRVRFFSYYFISIMSIP